MRCGGRTVALRCRVLDRYKDVLPAIHLLFFLRTAAILYCSPSTFMLLSVSSSAFKKSVSLALLAAPSQARFSHSLLSLGAATNSTRLGSPSHYNQSFPPSSHRHFAMGSNASTAANFPKGKTEDQWQAQLSPEQVRVFERDGNLW